MYKLFIYIIVPIFFSISCKSQEVIIKTYTNEEGIVGNIIHDAVQDNEGYIWVVTNEGLNRFDGNKFEYFSSEDLGINTSSIVSLFVDKNSYLWVVRSNMDKIKLNDPQEKEAIEFKIYDPKKNTVFTPKEIYGEAFPAWVDISDVYNDKDGNIWFSTFQGEIYKLGNSLELVYKHDIEEAFFYVFPLNEREFWVFGRKADHFFLAHIKDNVEVCKLYFPLLYYGSYNRSDFIKFHVDGRATIMLPKSEIRDQGIDFINKDSDCLNNYYSRLMKKVQVDISGYDFIGEDNHHHLWLRNDKDFKIIDSLGHFVTGFSSKEVGNITISDYTDIYDNNTFFDKDNRAWIFNYSKLASIQLNNNNFKTLLDEGGVSVRGMERINDSLIFVNTYSGFKICNTKQYTCNHFTAGANYSDGLGLCKQDSILWVGRSSYQLRKIDLNNQSDFTSYPTPSQGTIPYVDSHGVLWLGQKSGICIFDQKNEKIITLEDFKGSEALPTYSINHIVEFNEQIWCATNKGVLRLDNQEKTIRKYDYFNSNNILFIYPESEHKFWLGTKSAGLIKWNPKENTFKNITIEDGLADNTIYAVIKDNNSKYWLPSNRGLMRYDDERGNIEVFTTLDGISHNEFNVFSNYVDKKSGVIFFGGLNGITIFNPLEIPSKIPRRPWLSLDYIEYFDNQKNNIKKVYAPEGNSIELPPMSRNLTINYSLIDFTGEDRTFAYKLNDQSEWNYTQESFIQFFNLPYGMNKLIIKGYGINTLWAENQINLSVYMKRPFYLRTWFFILLLVAIALMVWIYIKQREVRLQKEQEKLEKEVLKQTKQIVAYNKKILAQNNELEILNTSKDHLFAIIGHDLRNPFIYLQGVTQKLKYLINNNRFEEANVFAQKIDESSAQISGILDNLLNWGLANSGRFLNQPEKLNIKLICEDVLELVEPLANLKNIVFDIHIADEDHLFVDRNIINVILRNIITNAVKFSNKNGVVNIEFYDLKDNACLTIRDNGVGMTKQQINHVFSGRSFESSVGTIGEKGSGMGLMLCIKLMEISGGQMKINSAPNEGVRIDLQFSKLL